MFLLSYRVKKIQIGLNLRKYRVRIYSYPEHCNHQYYLRCINCVSLCLVSLIVSDVVIVIQTMILI